MEVSPSAAVRLLLPLTPLILKTAFLNVLSRSKCSSKQDTKTEVAVVVMRRLMSVERPLGRIQRLSLRDGGIKGRMWVSKVAIPVPEGSEAEMLNNSIVWAINVLGDGSETYSYSIPQTAAVEGEWTGYRDGVDANAARPAMAEAEQFAQLMGETSLSSPVTILYFHGGGYFLMDPSSHRSTVASLAKRTHGRCFSVRYRLAPQHPFPSQLLDALTSFLYLLAPPPGSFHEPVPARHIVFAGDSAGGNLCFALLLLILTLRRLGVSTLKFHGKDVPLDLPAGVATNSPWLDISHSMPSTRENAHFDYLNVHNTNNTGDSPPTDTIWPTSPPRAEIFCEASMLTHPLVSPVSATVEMWQNAPPVFVCTGNESLQNEAEITARRIHQAGAQVQFVGYEGMPHCFAMIFPTSTAGRDCFHRWAAFCNSCAATTDGNLSLQSPQNAQGSKALWMKAFSNPPEFEEVPLDQLCASTIDEDVQRAMQDSRNKALLREREARSRWEEACSSNETTTTTAAAATTTTNRAKL